MAQYRFVVSGDFVEFYDGSQFVTKLRNTSQDVDWYYDNTPGMWFEINGYKYKVESASEIEIDGDVLSVVSDFDAAIEDIFPNLAGGSGSPTEPQNLAEVLAEGNDAGEIVISNLGDPVENHDAIHKEYADSLISTPNLATVLGEGNDGDGLIINNIGYPDSETDAATKGYVDGGVEIAATFATISVSTRKRFVYVEADETNNGDISLYLHNGTTLKFIQTIE